MLCQEDLHNLAEDAPLKQPFPEALRIVRQEIGQLIKLVKDEDTGEEAAMSTIPPQCPCLSRA